MRRASKKRILVLSAALGVLLIFWAWDSESPRPGSASAPVTQTGRGTGSARASTPPPSAEEGLRPLPLWALERLASASVEPGRNIFVYYVAPPPVMKEPEGPPPSIRITSVVPESVYARTGDFLLRVRAERFPDDARIFINGQAHPTERVSPTELKTTVGRQWIATPGKLTILVRNERGETSAPVALTVLEPPAPGYKYVGRIGDMVFLASGEDRYAVRLGQLVDEKKGDRWRVVSASDTHVMIQDAVLGVTHRVEMEALQTAAAAPTSPAQMTPLDRRRLIQERLRRQMEEMNAEEEELQSEPPPDEQQELEPKQPPVPGQPGRPLTPQQIRQQLQLQLQQLRNRPNRN